jgi:hypothetical protein
MGITSLMKPGAAAGGEQRRSTLSTSFVEAVHDVGGQRAPRVQELRARAHHVLARRQEEAQLVEVEPARHVEDAVGVEGDERVDVVGGRDSGDRTGPRQLAGVDANLVGTEHAHPHDLEVGVPE